jgi:hypothetical protein
MSQQLCMYFGQFTISWASHSKQAIDRLKELFAGYESTRAPDIALQIDISPDLPHPCDVTQTQWNAFAVHGNSFDMGPQVLQGTFSHDYKEMVVTAHEDVFKPQFLHVLHEFLYRLYYTLCSLYIRDSWIIHACGIIRDNIGYLFIGPHQSGKTTIGMLSGAPVLHDDQMIITREGNTLTMDSTPLPARLNRRQRPARPCTLQRIFLAVRDNRFFVNRLTPERALSCLYNDIVLPHTLLSADGQHARRRKATVCLALQQAVPLFELHFDREGRFWEHLSTMKWE